MLQNIINADGLRTQRPVFLSVLCLIGFIGSFICIIENSIGFFKAQVEVNQIQSGVEKTQLKNIFSASNAPHTPITNISNLTPENYQKFSIGGIVASLLSIVGIVLMWLLKKNGFYSFCLGTFFNIITHFLLFGDNIGAMGLSLIWAIFGLILAVLYSRFLYRMD